MADYNTLTLAGNLTQDPELRYTSSGTALCDLQMATSKSVKNENGEWENKDTVFWTITAWRQLAENAAASLKKGMSIIVIGTPVTKEWEGKDGTKRTKVELNADHVALSLNRYAVTAEKTTNGGSASNTSWQNPVPAADNSDTPF